MKSIIRWGKALGLAGTIWVGSLVSSGMAALALTNEQVIQRLGPVPVFTLANQERNLLLLRCPGQNAGQEVRCIHIFIGVQDAQGFLTELRQQNAEVGNAVEVLPLSLAQVYQEMIQEREEPLVVRFIPSIEDIQAARTVVQQSGGNPDEFRGVPLFVARSGGEGDEEVYLSNERNGQVYIPMFFSWEQLQRQIDRLKQEKPDLVSGVEVEVWNLESIMQAFHSQNDQELTQLEFVPYTESYEYVRSLQQQTQNAPRSTQPTPQARPAQPPAPGASPAQQLQP